MATASSDVAGELRGRSRLSSGPSGGAHSGRRRELDELVGNIARTPLDRSRPLWEFHFAEGMAGHRFAIIGKLHHALADGVASANLLARVMDLAGPVQDERDNDTTCVPPSTAELLRGAGRDHGHQAAALPRVITDPLS